MKKRWKKLFVSVVALLLAMGLGATTIAYAEAPYKTYTVDGYGSVTETQTAYLPCGTINKFGDVLLYEPVDFTILSDGTMYILDSAKKNTKVLITDVNGNFYGSFGEDVLQDPYGIYVTEERICYVADRDARTVFVFDKDGKLMNSYGRPDEPLYGDALDFLPLKVVANDSGTIYVICESNTNGIVQISPTEGGTFLGYFGTNATNANLWTIVWRSLLTDVARAKMVSNLPATPDNMAIDKKGLIYTVTGGENEDTLKRLNIAGGNMIEPDAYDQYPAAVAVGNHDNVYVLSEQGYIYEYNNDGELLFVFGGSDDGQQRMGLSRAAKAIQVASDDKIYVLDADKKQVLIFEPTEFTNHLHEALYLFSKGLYTESKEPLSEVLRMNNLFDYANMAMGRTLYKEGNYDDALEYSILAKDFDGYSDAFWEIRNNWLKKNLATAIVLLLVLYAVSKVVGVLDKKKHILKPVRRLLAKIKEKRLVKELSYLFYFMKHPIDGCYGIKREGKVSLLSSNILLSIGILFFIINKYFAGFLQKNVREGQYDIPSDIGFILLVLLLVVGCNYLMCTINDGEGRLKHIYCSFIYSFGPYFVLQPVLFAFSHVVTYNEVFFIQFGNLCMLVWIGVLIFLSIREINNYTVKETVKIIGLTIFTILIVCLLAFIIYVLWSQVFDFVQSICGEVVYKIGN